MAVRTKTAAYALGNTVERQMAFTSVFNKTSGGVFTDLTSASANNTNADVTWTLASGDELYLGSSDNKFCALYIQTGGTTTGGTRTWQYWNGTAWTTMPTMTFSPGNANHTAGQNVGAWDDTACTGWAKTTINSVSAYWIRGVVGTAYPGTGSGSVITGAMYENLCTGVRGGTRTINIPETVSRTFRSVTLRIHYQAPYLANFDLFRLRLTLGAGSLTLIDDASLMNQALPLESTSLVVEYDITSSFTTSFTSTSHSLEVEAAALWRGVASTAGTNWVHWSAQLYISYDSDDDPAQNATQLNTLYIPFESLTSALGITQTTIGGTGGIPILTGGSGFIKEVTSPTIVEEAIVYIYNSQESGSTNYQFIGQVDSEAETTLSNFNVTNNSDYYMEVQWSRLDLSKSAAHDIKARVSNATGAAPVHVGGYIIVTYTYAASGITQRNMSLIIPVMQNPSYYRGTTSADAAITQTQFWIEETSPTLLASAVMMYINQAADPGSYLLACGAQTARSYIVTADVTVGPIPITQRFDSGGAAGSGLTFGRGLNTLTISSYVDTTPTNGGAEYGLIYLNYYAAVSSTARTTYARWLLKQWSWTVGVRQTVSFAFPIAETNYLLMSAGYVLTLYTLDTVRTGSISISKGSSAGWYNDTSGSGGSSDANIGYRMSDAGVIAAFKRYPTDPDVSRVDIETTRNYILETNSVRACVTVHLVYHDFAFTVSGQLANYSGDGSGITVNIYSKLIGKIGSVTTTTGGNYTFTWYDNTALDVWAEARQSGILLGRSDDGTAS